MLFGTTPVWSHSELLLTSTIGILIFDNSLICSLFTSTISANANFTVNKQTIILDHYTNTPSYKVGLKINESIITAKDDPSLYLSLIHI